MGSVLCTRGSSWRSHYHSRKTSVQGCWEKHHIDRKVELTGFDQWQIKLPSNKQDFMNRNESARKKRVFFFGLIPQSPAADLRLRERGRMWGEQRPPSSSVMLSVLPKCLDKKWSSSMVGWKGSWCSRSWEELEDCRWEGHGGEWQVRKGIKMIGGDLPVRKTRNTLMTLYSWFLLHLFCFHTENYFRINISF